MRLLFLEALKILCDPKPNKTKTTDPVEMLISPKKKKCPGLFIVQDRAVKDTAFSHDSMLEGFLLSLQPHA